MARVVLVVDSATGALVDVAGNVREGGRYKKFVKRILSTDKNPVLDYGGNGGDTLIISKGGGRGKAINLRADIVNVDGELKIGGKTIAEIATSGSADVLNLIAGTEGEVSVGEVYVTDSSSGEDHRYIQISLDQKVIGKLEMIDAALGGITSLVRKSDVAALAKDLSVQAGDTLEDVKGTLRVLLDRIGDLAGSSSSSSSSS
jgi:LysM repeat protein